MPKIKDWVKLNKIVSWVDASKAYADVATAQADGAAAYAVSSTFFIVLGYIFLFIILVIFSFFIYPKYRY